MPPFDLSKSLLLMDNDEELLREMLAIFLSTYGEQLQVIRTALTDRDSVALVKAAHRLKGTLSVFGITALTEKAAALETMGKHGRLHEAETLFETLTQSVIAFAATAQATIGASLDQPSAARECCE